MNKICGIYKITSPSGKIYIGQSKDVNARLQYYKNSRCKCQQKLYHSIIKYRWNTHTFEIIVECLESELNDLEAYYIKQFNTFNTKHGLNLTTGGNHYKMSDETKLKIGAASKVRICTEETRIKLSQNSAKAFFGKHHTDESKEKLRIKHLGKNLLKSIEKN